MFCHENNSLTRLIIFINNYLHFIFYCNCLNLQTFDLASDPTNPCQRWLPQKCWENITQLENLPKFLGITVSLDETSRNWQKWYLASEPEKISLPGEMNCYFLSYCYILFMLIFYVFMKFLIVFLHAFLKETGGMCAMILKDYY